MRGQVFEAVFVHVGVLGEFELHGIHGVIGAAIMSSDVAALEAAIGDVAVAPRAPPARARNTSSKRSCSDGEQLAPLAVPRLKSGNWPSKNIGTRLLMECPSHSTTRGCSSRILANSLASASW